MKKRAALFFFGIVFGLLLATALALQSHPVEEYARGKLATLLKNELYSTVHIGSLQIRVIALQPHVDLYDVDVTPNVPSGRTPYDHPTLSAKAVKVYLHPVQLLASQVHIDRVEIEGPKVDVEVRQGQVYGLPAPLLGQAQAPVSAGGSDSTGRIDAFVINDGDLHFKADDPKLDVTLSGFDALATIEANDSVVADVRSAGKRIVTRIGEDDFDEEIRALSGEIAIKGSTLEIKSSHLEAGPLTGDATGTIALGGGTDVQLGTLHVIAPLDLTKKIDPKLPTLRGQLDWNGSLAVKGKSIKAQGTAHIPDYSLEQFHFGDTTAEIEMAGTKAFAKKLTIRQGNGTIEGQAQLTWTDPDDILLGVDVNLADFQFARVLDSLGIDGAHVDSRLWGPVKFEGSVSPVNIHGTASLDHKSFTWREARWDDPRYVRPNLVVPGGHVDGQFKVTEDQLSFSSFTATAGSSAMTGSGWLAFKGAADISFDCEPLAMGELTMPIHLAGTGPAKGRIHGDFDHLVVDGDLNLAGTQVGGLDFGQGVGDIRFDAHDLLLASEHTTFTRGGDATRAGTVYSGPWKVDFHDPISMDFDVQTKNGRIEDLSDILWAKIPYGPASKYVKGEVSGRIHLTGPLDTMSGSYTASAAGVKIYATDGTTELQRFDRLTSDGRWVNGVIWADDLLATTHAGAQLFGRGSLGLPDEKHPELGGSVNVELHTARFTLADVSLFGPDSALESDVGLRMHIGGRFYQPEFNGRLDLTNSRYHGAQLGASQANFDTIERAQPGSTPGVKDLLRVDGNLAGGSVKGTADVILGGDLDFHTELAAIRHPIKAYLWYFNPRLVRDEDFSAWASGTVAVHGGSLMHPELSLYDVKLNELRFARGGGKHFLGNHEPIDFSFGRGNVTVRDFSLAGDETDFHFHGSQSSDGKVDFHGKGSLDLAFTELLTDQLSRVEGVVDVSDLTISGNANAPEVRGKAQIHDGVFKPRYFPVGTTDVAGPIEFTESRILFPRYATGRLEGGSFQGWGSMDLDGFRVRGWDLHAKIFDGTVRFSSYGLSARGSGQLDFEGPSSGPLLSGNLDLSEGRYTMPVDWKAMAVSFNQRANVFASPDQSSRLFGLNISMQADSNLWVKNDLCDCEFRIRHDDPLRVEGDNAQWSIAGTLEALRGRATFNGRDWAITSGVVTFAGDPTFDFRYDVEADAQIRDWDVQARVSGRRSSQPVAEFSSNPPLPEVDLKTLVASNETTEEAIASGQNAALALGVLGSVVGQGFADQRGVTGKVKTLLKLDQVDVVPTYTSGQAGLKTVVKKVVNNDLTLLGSVGQSGRTTGTLQADYRAGKRMHVVFGWTNDPEDTEDTAPSVVLGPHDDLSLDAKFRFEWK